MIQPLAPGSCSVHFAPGSTVNSLALNSCCAVDRAVDDPAVGVALAAARCVDDRLQVIVLLEMRIDVLLPIELLDDEVEILVLLLGHVLDQQRPGHFAPFDQRLEHAEHVGSPLRLVGAKRAGRVQHAGRNQPAGAALQAIGLRQIENAVVPLVPVFQALAELGLASCPAPGP